jgi:hypothetical protein
MPQPEGLQLNPSGYVPFLSTIAGGLLPTFDEFIAPMVAPTVPVAAPSGTYNVWKRADFMRRGGTQDADFVNAKIRFVTWKGALEKEIAVATLVQTAANWNTTYAGVNSGPTGQQFLAWDQAASDPVDDVVAWIEALRLSSGIQMNTMIIPIAIMNKLKVNQNLLDRIKYGGTMTNPTEVTFQQIQGLFGIPKLLIPKGVYNTANEGQAQNLQYIWGRTTMWMGYVADTPSRETPSAIYNFAWTGDTAQGLPVGISPGGGGPQPWDASEDPEIAGLFMRRFRENRPNGEFLESELWITPNVTGADFGVTFTAAIT